MNLKRKLNQYIVYWPPAGLGSSLSTTYGDPIELKCRWENMTQAMMDGNGDKWMSKSAIDTLVPLKDLGVVWKGRLADVEDLSLPLLNPGASAIRSSEEIPNRLANQTLYTAFL